MAYYNRKKQTINTLNYFNEAYLKYNFEVIIVDDNSTDEHDLTNIYKTYNYPIKYIKITKEEKGDRINPSVVYNKGFREAEGNMVIIQNPECIHVGDLLNLFKKNVTHDNYVAASCYNCASEELTHELLNDLSLINNVNFHNRNSFHWYNHPRFRPVHYHFCAAMMNDNLKVLGGFDEDFADGHSYDDNEFLLSIEHCLKLDIKSVDIEEGFVIHQWHGRDAENSVSENKINNLYNELIDSKLKKKVEKNKLLYANLLKEHKKYNYNFPKILHLYWDCSSFSYLNLMTVLSFMKCHVGWKINIYCPKNPNKNISWITDEQKYKYIGKDYFDELKKINNVLIHKIDTDDLPFKYKEASEVIKSDYFRLYVLNKYGGVWSDFDIIYTNNIEKHYKQKKINSKKTLIIYKYWWNEAERFVYPVGLFISQKRNSILTKILENIELFYDKSNYQCLGCKMFEKIFNNYKQNSILKNILYSMKLSELWVENSDCYLKIKWNELDILYDREIKEDYFENDSEIFGIHWFNGADKSKEYCNNLDIEKLKVSEAKCLVDRLVKKYI